MYNKPIMVQKERGFSKGTKMRDIPLEIVSLTAIFIARVGRQEGTGLKYE